MLYKSNLYHIPGDLSNAHAADIRHIHEHRIPLDVPYLISHWVSGSNYLDSWIIPYA